MGLGDEVPLITLHNHLAIGGCSDARRDVCGGSTSGGCAPG